MKKTLLITVASVGLIACSSDNKELEIEALTSHTPSGTQGVRVATILGQPDNSNAIKVTTSYGQSYHRNNGIYLDAPLTTDDQRASIVVQAVNGSEVLSEASLLVSVFADEEYRVLVQSAQQTLSKLKSGVKEAEEIAILSFLNDVGVTSGAITEEAASQTSAWAHSVLEDSQKQSAYLFESALSQHEDGLYDYTPFVSVFETLDSNPVVEYLSTLIDSLGLEYSQLPGVEFKPEHLSRFYGDGLLGDWSEGVFHFDDAYGYLRVIPAYAAAKCEGQ